MLVYVIIENICSNTVKLIAKTIEFQKIKQGLLKKITNIGSLSLPTKKNSANNL